MCTCDISLKLFISNTFLYMAYLNQSQYFIGILKQCGLQDHFEIHFWTQFHSLKKFLDFILLAGLALG